jgi:ABC-type lipoprotein export system ATPase subunit
MAPRRPAAAAEEDDDVEAVLPPAPPPRARPPSATPSALNGQQQRPPSAAAFVRPPSALTLDKSLPSFLAAGAVPDSPRCTFGGKGVSVTVRGLTFEVVDNRPQDKKKKKGDNKEDGAAATAKGASTELPELVIHGGVGDSSGSGSGGSSVPGPPSPQQQQQGLKVDATATTTTTTTTPNPLLERSPTPQPASRTGRLLAALSGAARKPRVALLSDVTAAFPAGRLTALMGPSGSGKSTLLDLMSGRKTTGRVTTGTILFAGQKASAPFLRRYAGYVEQFDTLLPVLTPREMLLYTAELKRPMSEPRSAKREAVESVLDKLALRSCADVMIGSALQKGISGGQSKRTNIGIALVTSPRVLFLGESF